ncbi:MAG: hypothetical protein ACRDHU_11290 [Actinomycetota bacterium]
MRRAFVALALALAACDGTGGDVGSATRSPTVTAPTTTATPSASVTVSATTSPTSSPSPPPDLRLPPDAPTTFDGAVSAEGPFEQLAPPGSEVLDVWFQKPAGEASAIAGVVWGRGDDPFARELGVVVWQESPQAPAWRATFAFTDEPAKGVLGISLDVADLTLDGLDDALTLEQTGGTGACGVWRVIAPFDGGASQVLRRATCDAQIAIVDTHLELTEAVFEPNDAHCCPSAFRTTTIEWDGSEFVETDVRVEEVDG